MSPTTTRTNHWTLPTRTAAIITTTAKTSTTGSTSKHSTLRSSATSDDDKNMLVYYLAAGIVVLIVIGRSNFYSFLTATFKFFHLHFWYKSIVTISYWKQKQSVFLWIFRMSIKAKNMNTWVLCMQEHGPNSLCCLESFSGHWFNGTNATSSA